MRQQQLVRDAQCDLRVAQPGRVQSVGVPSEGDHLRLVHRDPVLDPVTQPRADDVRELREPLDRLGRRPATLLLQRLREIPVVERGERTDPRLKQRIDDAIVEIQTPRIHLAVRIGEYARPRDREAVRVDAERGDVPHVLEIAVVMVTGHVAAGRVVDRAGLAAEHIPDRRRLAVGVVSPLDLICARRHAEDEAARETGAHFSTPVMTMPRMNARCAMKKITTGATSDIIAAAWMSVGFWEKSALNPAMPTDSGCASMLPWR